MEKAITNSMDCVEKGSMADFNLSMGEKVRIPGAGKTLLEEGVLDLVLPCRRNGRKDTYILSALFTDNAVDPGDPAFAHYSGDYYRLWDGAVLLPILNGREDCGHHCAVIKKEIYDKFGSVVDGYHVIKFVVKKDDPKENAEHFDRMAQDYISSIQWLSAYIYDNI